MDRINTQHSYFKLQHVNGDFEVTMEFNAETLTDVAAFIKGFLKGCTFTDTAVDEVIKED